MLASRIGRFGRPGGALLLAVAVAVVGYLSLSALPLRAADPEKNAKPDEEITRLLKERVALAKKACEAAAAGFGEIKRIGGVNFLVVKPEEVYTWSVRWLQAEHDLNPKEADYIAALEAHLKRMKELEKKVDGLTPDILPDTGDGKWYRLEAELWLAQAKAKAKK